jgi:hypothetical protein
MSNGAAGGAAGAYAAVANAIKALGAIVRLKEEDFIKVISRSENSVIIVSRGGFMKKDFDYLAAYKGFIFYVRTKNEINLPGNAEIISAQQIWIPSL